MPKTYSAKPSEVKKAFLLINAAGLRPGRLASRIAMILRGKHKPTFTPHIDCGDNVIVINAEKVAFTGKKLDDKKYYRHTGHPGGIKEITAGKILDGRYPERVLMKAVERMMPKDSPLARAQMTKLKIYSGDEHPHVAQQPQEYDFGSMNKKNKKVS